MADSDHIEYLADLPDDPDEKRIFAFDNGQMRFEALYIGVGNFLEETFTDDDGSTHEGMRCGFWMRAPGRDEERIRVHPGLEFDFEGYHIRVHVLARQDGRWLAGVGIKTTVA